MADLGRGPRVVCESILPLLHIGEEGRRIFDMARIVEAVRGGLIAKSMASAGGSGAFGDIG
jgi:hypothetical protein